MLVIHAENRFRNTPFQNAINAVATASDNAFRTINEYECLYNCLYYAVKEYLALQKQFIKTPTERIGIMINNVENAIREMVGV